MQRSANQPDPPIRAENQSHGAYSLPESKSSGMSTSVSESVEEVKQAKFAVRQAISKALVAYYQKYVDEAQKIEIKDAFMHYDRTLLVADPRRCEPKKFGFFSIAH
jgi:hypothetical protein